MSQPNSNPEPQDGAAYYKRVLHELVDMGADIARMVHAEAKRHDEAATAAPADRPLPIGPC